MYICIYIYVYMYIERYKASHFVFIQIPNEAHESENRSSIIEDEISEIAQIRKAVPD